MLLVGAGEACRNELLQEGFSGLSNACLIAGLESYDWDSNLKSCEDSCKNVLNEVKEYIEPLLGSPSSIIQKFKSAKEKEPSKFESAYEDAKQCILGIANDEVMSKTTKACTSTKQYCKPLGCMEEFNNLF